MSIMNDGLGLVSYLSYIQDIKKGDNFMFQEHLKSSKSNMNNIMNKVRNDYIRSAPERGDSAYLTYLAIKTGDIIFCPNIMDWEDDCPSWSFGFKDDYEPKSVSKKRLKKLLRMR